MTDHGGGGQKIIGIYAEGYCHAISRNFAKIHITLRGYDLLNFAKVQITLSGYDLY